MLDDGGSFAPPKWKARTRLHLASTDTAALGAPDSERMLLAQEWDEESQTFRVVSHRRFLRYEEAEIDGVKARLPVWGEPIEGVAVAIRDIDAPQGRV